MTADAPPVLLWAHRISDPLRLTGVGRYVASLTPALAAAAGEAGPRYALCSPSEATEPDWLPAEVEVRRLTRFRRALHLSWLATGRPAIERLAGPAAAVHVMYPALPVPSRAPLVVTVHDLFAVEHPEWFPWIERRGGATALARARDGAAAVVTDTDTVRRALIERGFDESRVETVWLGIDDRFRRPVPPAEAAAVAERYGVDPGEYVVALGAATERKNLDVLLRALAQLAPPVTLLLAGPPGPRSAAVAAEAERLGVADRVRTTGFVPDGDLPALLAGALALAHPSLEEGFGFTPLEAMASGAPTVVARSGSLPEVVGDAAAVLDPHDAGAWAEAIALLAGDADHRARTVAAGRRRAARFTWSATAEAVLAVHRRVIGAA